MFNKLKYCESDESVIIGQELKSKPLNTTLITNIESDYHSPVYRETWAASVLNDTQEPLC